MTSKEAPIDENLKDVELAPLDALIGDATVVGLGESVFTPRVDLKPLRQAIARHLIEKMGFRAITIESSWGDALAATHYVEACKKARLLQRFRAFSRFGKARIWATS